jgi:FkbM family methyltransferase
MLYFNGVYEPESTAFVRQFLRPGDVFLDVGANAGYYTMMAASIIGDQGRVHAFEPNPEVAALLRVSVQCGKFTERVVVAAMALGARAGSATLYLPHEAWNTGEASLLHTAWTSRERTLTVPVATLDDYCERNGVSRIRLIKMDVEGAELEVLEGARSVLKNLRPEALLCEFFPARRPEAQVQVLELLSGCGYRSFIVNHDGSLRPHDGSLPDWEWGNLCFLASDL